MIDPAELPQGPFRVRSEFHAAVRVAVALARRELLFFDRDLSDWPLNEAGVCEALGFLAAGGGPGTIRLLVRNSAWLDAQPARLAALRRRHGSVIEARCAPQYDGVSEGVLIVDGIHWVKRFHSDHFRGRFSAQAGTEIEASAPRYRTLWNQATPCAPVAPFGL
jgi:hypothetical protein